MVDDSRGDNDDDDVVLVGMKFVDDADGRRNLSLPPAPPQPGIFPSSTSSTVSSHLRLRVDDDDAPPPPSVVVGLLEAAIFATSSSSSSIIEEYDCCSQ